MFVVGLDEGVLPCDRAYGDQALEEERRLYYSAVTRASDCLYVCSGSTRMLAGGMRKLAVSRFVRDAPPARIVA